MVDLQVETRHEEKREPLQIKLASEHAQLTLTRSQQEVRSETKENIRYAQSLRFFYFNRK